MTATCRWSTSALVAALWLMPAGGEASAPKSKVMIALIAGAQKEFDGGNFERAAELFTEIWRQDAGNVVALYNAARASHLAGKLDKADELYGELRKPGVLDEATAAKVARYADDLRRLRAERIAEQAAAAERSNQFALAAQLWTQADQMTPKPAWQLRAARAHHLAGDRDTALAQYDRFLATAAADDAGRVDAQRWQAELRPPKPAAPGAQAGPATVATAAPAARSWGPYAVIGGSALLLGTGLVVLGMAGSDDAALQDKLAKVNANARVDGIRYSEATAEAGRIEGQYRLGWVLAGVGAVGGGVGAWWWWRGRSAAVACVPSVGGLAIAGRF